MKVQIILDFHSGERSFLTYVFIFRWCFTYCYRNPINGLLGTFHQCRIHWHRQSKVVSGYSYFGKFKSEAHSWSNRPKIRLKSEIFSYFPPLQIHQMMIWSFRQHNFTQGTKILRYTAINMLHDDVKILT